MNKEIVTDSLHDHNMQVVNTIYLTYFREPSDSLWQFGMLTDSNAIAKLYSIASQCYLTGGPAVFQARSLYWIAVNDYSMAFYDECVNGSLDQYEVDKTAPPSDTVATDTVPIAKQMMDQEPNYAKGFNDGYKLARYSPDISRS